MWHNTDHKSTLVNSMRAETRRQSPALFNLCWEHAYWDSNILLFCTCLRVTIKAWQVWRIAYWLQATRASLVVQLVKNPPAMWETWVWPLGWEDTLEEGEGTHLQYSGLENSMDYLVHGVTKSQTQLSNFPFSSVPSSCSVVSNSVWPHRLPHARPPCPSPIPRAYSNSRPSSQWCHPTISSSVVPSSSCLQSFPASGSSQMSQFFTSAGQSIGVSASASVFLMNIQDWFPLGWAGWISFSPRGYK